MAPCFVLIPLSRQATSLGGVPEAGKQASLEQDEVQPLHASMTQAKTSRAVAYLRKFIMAAVRMASGGLPRECLLVLPSENSHDVCCVCAALSCARSAHQLLASQTSRQTSAYKQPCMLLMPA